MRPEVHAEVELSPAFHDFDPMDVVWHGHYLKAWSWTDVASGAVLTRAHTIQVAVATGEMCLASPPVLARKLGLES